MDATIAHATWFTEGPPPIDLTAVARPATMVAIVGAVIVAAVWRRVAASPPARVLRPLAPLGRLGHLGPWVPRLLAVHVGLSLVAMAWRGAYLAPSNLAPADLEGSLLLAFEAVVGIWLLLGVRIRPAAWSLLAAGPLGMVSFGVLPIVERLDLLGVAIFLALLPPAGSNPRGPVHLEPRRVRPALFGMRLLVGSALIVVSFTEKLARPGMTRHFLADHPHFNVAQLVGLPVSDELFVQLAGGVEILLGLLLISGALPQLVALLAAAPFTATLPFLGADELIGHLPIYGVLLTLVILGSRPDTAAVCAWLPRPRRTDAPPSVDTEDRSPVELTTAA
jgi:uncharacterized membrane protein YphA (DoxX/SURF4 family)